jgi:hypothetical protein
MCAATSYVDMSGSVITSCEFTCLQTRIYNNILRSTERRPFSVNAGCTRPWSQVVYATVWIMSTSMKHDMLFRVIRRNTTKSPNKYAILDDTPTPVRMHFFVRHRVWRSWSWVKLICLYGRLRLGVVPTYYPVNSWSSRSSSCEESPFPYLHTHIVEDFKLSPHNCRCWNAILEIFQNFPFSETHQFRYRYSILCQTKNFTKNWLKTSSETRLLSVDETVNSLVLVCGLEGRP